MINELKKMIDQAEKLPEDQQKSIGELILNEIGRKHSFQSSQDKLSLQAKEALTE